MSAIPTVFDDPADTRALRDWLAGQAIVGILAERWYRDGLEAGAARQAYALADAMLKVREESSHE